MKLNWQCPFCDRKAVVHSGEHGGVSSFRHEFNHDNKYGYQAVRGQIVVCPNDQCKEYSLVVSLHDHKQVGGQFIDVTAKRIWRLVPESEAKVFPDYIPKGIREDYVEACLICDLSAKASATLSRRCLQGIIRNFWKVSKSRLVDEIDAIRDKIDPDTWEAIDSVRHIGNIGAHMERDINLIIDVDAEEARLLIGLIETLLTDWYIARHDRHERMQKLKNAAEQKKALRKNQTID